MRKILLLVSLIMLVSFASAAVTQNNIIKYGIIEDDGSLTTTSTLITNSNVIGYNCTSSSCDAVSGLFLTDTSVPGSNIVITYPTTLGVYEYGLYFYKMGYIPFEANATWYGTGNVPWDFSAYLTQKRNCEIPLDNLNVNYANGNITVSADISSPVNHDGPLNYIPSSISNQYTVDVKVNLSITGTSGYNQVKTVNIPFSDTSNVQFSKSFGNGNYTIRINAYTDGDKCINSNSILLTDDISINVPGNVTNDTTAPGSVTNLRAITRTNVSILWGWDNPSDSDFDGTLLYLDGTNVANLTSSVNSYIALGLTPNTVHTLTVYTKDSTGNVNTTPVSNTTSTLPNAVIPDTTAPGAITDLHVINKTNTTITWAWNNPSDSDFDGTIIYLNGVYNGTLNSATSQITFTGLNPGTNYTITVNTFDTTGNVNYTNVSNTAQTLANGVPADTSPPVVHIFYPGSGTYNYNITVLGYTIYDNVGLDVCWYTLNKGVTNNTLSCTGNNVTGLLANPGTNTWRVYARDTSGNIGQASITFCINNTNSTGGGDDDDDDDGGDDGGNDTIIYHDGNGVTKLASYNITEEYRNLPPKGYNESSSDYSLSKKKTGYDYWWVWLLVLLLIEIIMLVVLIIIASKRK